MTALHAFLSLLMCFAVLLLAPLPAHALKSITVSPEQDRIEITTLGELYEGRGDSLQLETAANQDGTTGRMTVRATTPGTNPSWIVFALTNSSDTAIERWLAADRYTVIGSGAVWPDLDARRIEAVTPSVGFVPERIQSERADLFRITLEPGQTITYVAELSSERFARIHLWKPLDYELKVRERQLFNGVMLGLTGLLAIFLTAIFAANHKIIFPSAALVAWCVLAYLCVDFGFFHKLFQLKPENNAVYRAACESAMAASLVIFLYFFLRIQLWHGLARMLFSVWIVAQLALVAVAVIDPRLASTFARLSFAAIGGFGAAITLFLALRGQDRALSLIPTWMLFLVWVFGAGVTLTGQLSGDMVVSGLVAGLVLIVVLIGFTVTQFAFRSLEPMYGAAPSELQLRSVALEAAGAGVWEWSARRDEIKISGTVEAALGLNQGELNTKVDDFTRHIHPSDRERFKLSLVATQERNDGRVVTAFRLRHADNSYRWFELEAAAMPSSDGRTMKSVGLLRDVTDSKRAQERLMNDAVKCSLTGLPNRQLLLDRLGIALQRAKSEPNIRPTVIFVDLDKFKSVNAAYGIVVGDSLLLTVARRLQRHLEADETLARAGGDRFAILLIKERSATDLAALAERVRRSLRSPIKLAGQDIVLTGSLGIAIYDGQQTGDLDLLREAEIAMYRAKRAGADHIEIFRPEMRGQADERSVAESEIRKAVEKNQIKVFYQPIVYMPTEELAGFQAIARWEHPKHGLLNPYGVVNGEGASELGARIALQVVNRALHDCVIWQKELPRADKPLFVNYNLSDCVGLRQEFAQEIRAALSRHTVSKGSLKLGVPESLVMENPEQTTEALEWLRGAGAELVLDDFGSGYSSLLYLGRMPFEAVRIERALIQAASGKDTGGSGLLKAMMALVHELGRKVVVDGVENDDDVSFLRSVDCEYGQGFYYGEPISERDVLQLLKLVRKSERRMQPRGLFRATGSKKRAKDQVAEDAAPQPTRDEPLPDATGQPILVPGAGDTGSDAGTTQPDGAPRRPALTNQSVRTRPLSPRPVPADAPPLLPAHVPAQVAAFGAPPPAGTGNGNSHGNGYATLRPVPPVAMTSPPPPPPQTNGHTEMLAGFAAPAPGPFPVPLANLEPMTPPPAVPFVLPHASAAPGAPPAQENWAASPGASHATQIPPGLPPVQAGAPAQPTSAAGHANAIAVPVQKLPPRSPAPLPNLDKLPPSIAASLQRLAGGPPPPAAPAAMPRSTGTDGGSADK